MKKNRQFGFMLAEAFVVSTLVLGILVFMYVQINTILKNYQKSFLYDTVQGIYITNELVKFVNDVNNNGIAPALGENVDYIKINDYYNDEEWNEMLNLADVKTVIVGDGNKLKNLDVDDNISYKMKDYIKYANIKNKTVILVEFNNATFAALKI